MRTATLAIALTVFTACGAGPSVGSSSPQTIPSAATPGGSVVPTSASTATSSIRPTPAGVQSPSPTTSTVMLCELPFVAASQRIYETGDGTAGFLKLPGGTFRADPAGSMSQAPSGQYFVGAAPALPGAFFTPQRSWDATVKRWVPVPPQQVSADGTSYVYQVGPDVHLVVVATGTDKVIYRQPSGFPPTNWSGPQLLTFVAGGVYFSVDAAYKGSGGSAITVPADQVGLWRIDPASGQSRRVLSVSAVGLITTDGTALWTIFEDNASSPTGTLVRYDLSSGRADQWYSVSGSGMDLLGLDPAGNLIVWTYDYQGGLKIWRVSPPNGAAAIDSETYSGNVPYYGGNQFEFGPLVTDEHGVWFGSTNGVFIYHQSGLNKVADAAGIPVGQCA